MKWRFLTEKKDSLHWITGIKFVSETAPVSRPQDVAVPPAFELFDEKGRPLYVLSDSGPLFVGRSISESDLDKAEVLRERSREYLADTDWQVIRYVETGEPIPEEVRRKRAEARVNA